MSESDEPQVSQSEKATKRSRRKAERLNKQLTRHPKPMNPRSNSQKLYINSLNENELTFAIGPAGVGKTYVASRLFGEKLVSGCIKKIFLSRPPVAKSKHRMGFLPGDPDQKTAPWLVPVLDGLRDSMSPAELDRARRDNRIEVVPFEFMQGRTFGDAAWIVDEAENLDLDDFYITLTRQGENLTMAVCGDSKQSRINNSGLKYVAAMSEYFGMAGVGVIEFGEDDVVRSRQAKQWVKAFNRLDLSDVSNCDMNDGTELPNFIRKAI